MKIAFIHPHKAFLPEIDAYTDFFSRYGIETLTAHPREEARLKAEVEWHFMGLHPRRKKNAITIHEYASASIPPFSFYKDLLKRYVNDSPDYRVFNNEYVRKQYPFRDGIPDGIRDYGIRFRQVADIPVAEKKYDFVYLGAIDPKRKPDGLFHQFTRGGLSNHSLLVISKSYNEIEKRLSPFSNIYFKGPVPPEEVYPLLSQAAYAINYIPDRTPFNKQTSAKLLDYLNGRIPVITTDYEWVRAFQKKYGGNYFFLKKDLSNFSMEEIRAFPYRFPDLNEWTWERQIRRSGILNFLESKFPGRIDFGPTSA